MYACVTMIITLRPRALAHYLQAMAVLLGCDAQVDASPDGWSALMHAGAGGQVAVAKMLLAHRADVQLKNDVHQ